jgi:hypothetical protein
VEKSSAALQFFQTIGRTLSGRSTVKDLNASILHAPNVTFQGEDSLMGHAEQAVPKSPAEYTLECIAAKDQARFFQMGVRAEIIEKSEELVAARAGP